MRPSVFEESNRWYEGRSLPSLQMAGARREFELNRRPYASPILCAFSPNPQNLTGGGDPVILRDGIEPLINFFAKLKNSDIQTRFAVEVDIASKIEKAALQGHFFYKVVSPESTPRKRIVLLYDDFLKVKMAGYTKSLKRRGHDVYLLHTGLTDRDRGGISMDLELISKWLSCGAFLDSSLIDVTTKSQCADPYLLHVCLSAGANLLASEIVRKKKIRSVPLSPYHGFNIYGGT